MENKYSSHGYIRLWLPNSPNEQNLKRIRELISAPQLLREEFDRIYALVTGGQ